MEIIKDNGVPPQTQRQLGIDTTSRIVPLGAPGAFRFIVTSNCKFADEGDGHRRIGAQAEIEILEVGDQMMTTFLDEIVKEWKKLQARAKEQYDKMMEQANRRIQTAPASALEQLKKP